MTNGLGGTAVGLVAAYTTATGCRSRYNAAVVDGDAEEAGNGAGGDAPRGPENMTPLGSRGCRKARAGLLLGEGGKAGSVEGNSNAGRNMSRSANACSEVGWHPACKSPNTA